MTQAEPTPNWALSGVIGKGTEETLKVVTNSKVSKELSRAKVREKGALSGSKNQQIATEKVKDLQNTIKGNTKTAGTAGHATREAAEEKVKNSYQ